MVADILAGKSLNAEEWLPDIKSVENFYADILEAPSSEDNESVSDRKMIGLDTDKPITQTEIELAKGGWSVSAPGPDGITVNVVKRFENKDLFAL